MEFDDKLFYPNSNKILFRLLLLLLLAFTTHLRVLASSVLRFRDHTQWHTTVGRTPLHEWSASRRDLYLTNTQHPQQTNIPAPGGIRTRNPSRRAAADQRIRPLGHWDRHYSDLRFIIDNTTSLLTLRNMLMVLRFLKKKLDIHSKT